MSSTTKINLVLPMPKRTEYFNYRDLDDEYRKPLVMMLERLLDDEWHMAEDLAQETFLKIYEYPLDHDWSRINVFIAHIAKCFFIDYRKSNNGSMDARKYDDDPTFFFEEVEPNEHYDYVNPEQIITRDAVFSDMFQKLGTLTPINREILSKIFAEGLTMQEVAEDMDMTYANVRKRLQRMRQSLGEFEDVS